MMYDRRKSLLCLLVLAFAVLCHMCYMAPVQADTADEPLLATSPTASAPTPAAPPSVMESLTVPLPPFVLPPLIVPPLVAPRPPVIVTVRPRPHPPVHQPVPRPTAVTERIVHYGRSSRGRPLTAFVLDNGPHAASDTTLIFGGFHGNERTTPMIVTQLRRYLIQKPTAWPGRRVILVPYANPDGWSAGTRVNARNVDLNRNFPVDWSCTGRAARNNPGPAPASEPETRAMIHLLALYHPAKVVSLHSPLHCLNWTGPVGLAMAEAMKRCDHYRPTAHIGYPTPGSLGDYCGSLGIGIVTLELPQESEAASWTANRDALLTAICFDASK